MDGLEKARENVSRETAGTRAQSRQWCKPQEGWIKINIDTSCKQRSEHVMIGCVVRDDRGEFVCARSNLVRDRGFVRMFKTPQRGTLLS